MNVVTIANFENVIESSLRTQAEFVSQHQSLLWN